MCFAYFLWSQSTSLCSCCHHCCSALLTICYKAELSAPVTKFSCLRAGGKRCSRIVCTAERKKKKKRWREGDRARENADENTDRDNRGRRAEQPESDNVEMVILLGCGFWCKNPPVYKSQSACGSGGDECSLSTNWHTLVHIACSY